MLEDFSASYFLRGVRVKSSAIVICGRAREKLHHLGHNERRIEYPDLNLSEEYRVTRTLITKAL